MIMRFTRHAALLSLSAVVAAQSLDEVTEVTSCHAHGDELWCTAGDTELPVIGDVDPDTAPESYSGCHTHGDEL